MNASIHPAGPQLPDPAISHARAILRDLPPGAMRVVRLPAIPGRAFDTAESIAAAVRAEAKVAQRYIEVMVMTSPMAAVIVQSMERS